MLQTECETVSFMRWAGLRVTPVLRRPWIRLDNGETDAVRGCVMRRTLVNLFVAATSLGVLAGSWLGVVRADESRRAREVADQEAAALVEALRAVGVQPTPANPVASPATPNGTSGVSSTAVPTAVIPAATAVAGASATATPPTATPPAPGLIPAPAATAGTTPAVTATPAAAKAPTVTATPRRIIRPSRAS